SRCGDTIAEPSVQQLLRVRRRLRPRTVSPLPCSGPTCSSCDRLVLRFLVLTKAHASPSMNRIRPTALLFVFSSQDMIPGMSVFHHILRQPLTSVIAILAVTLAGGTLACAQQKKDTAPKHRLPVIYVAQPLKGLDPVEM